MKKYLEEFHQLKIFRKKDVLALTGDENAAKELLRRYKKHELVSQIRRDLYVVTDLVNKSSVASKYEIGSRISSTSYISYHSAMEYHGMGHQVFYDIFVCSDEKFRNFEYEGIHYLRCESTIDAGVISPQTDTLVKVTDLERTIIDCINRIDRCGGLEELIECLALITYADDEKLLDYLDAYKTQALYQRTGFILSYFQNEMKLRDTFFEECKTKTGKSVRYLTTDPTESDTYFKEWKLYAPKNILSFLEQGGTDYA